MDLWNWRGKQTISTQDLNFKSKGPLAIVKNVSNLNYISLFHTLYFNTMFIKKDKAFDAFGAFGEKQDKPLETVSLYKDINVEAKVRVKNNLSKLVDAKVDTPKSKEKIANGGRSNKFNITLRLLKQKIEPNLKNEQAYEANIKF